MLATEFIAVCRHELETSSAITAASAMPTAFKWLLLAGWESSLCLVSRRLDAVPRWCRKRALHARSSDARWSKHMWVSPFRFCLIRFLAGAATSAADSGSPAAFARMLHGLCDRCLAPPRKAKAQRNQEQLQPTQSAQIRHHVAFARMYHAPGYKYVNFKCFVINAELMSQLLSKV